jgi:hypothetical protein
LMEYAPQFSKFIESVLEPNMPSAPENTKTALQERIEKQQALRKASKEQIVKASQGITLEEARAKLKAEETERTERKLIETSKADISKVVTVLSDLGQTIVSDMRKAIKENKNKADLRKPKTRDGFVFKFYDTTTLQKAYEKIYGKEKTEELFKQALEFRQTNENISGTTKDSLPSYSDEERNRVIPQYSSAERLTTTGALVSGKERQKDFMILDREGENDLPTQLHEMTHSVQPGRSKNINPFWKDLLQEVYSVTKESQPKEKHAEIANFIEYMFSEVEMPAWLAGAKADYYLRYNKTFNPETVTFEDISEMFEKLSKDTATPNMYLSGYGVWYNMLKVFPKNDKYRKAIKDIFNSVAVVIPDTNERIA